MSLSIQEIIKNLGLVQLNYHKLNAEDFMDNSAPKPENISMKVQVPQYFRDIFTGLSIHIHAPSAAFNSLWHCLLYILCKERYSLASWEQKKIYVDKLIEELDEKINVRYSTNSTIIRNTSYEPLDLKFRAVFITDAVLFAVSQCLHINILVLGPSNWCFHYGDPVINMELPIIILNKDYQQCYSVVCINDQTLFDNLHIVNKTLRNKVPERNFYLEKILREGKTKDCNKTQTDREFIRQVKGQTVNEAQLDFTLKHLNRLKLSELKELVRTEGKDLSSISGRMTKAKIIELILA